MSNLRNALRIFFLSLILVSSSSYACDIVYGKDWSFVSKAPKNWNSACGENSLPGTNISLWPNGQKMETTTSLLYVQVFNKSLPNLKSFAADEQANVRKGVPNVSITPIKAPNIKGQPNYILVKLANLPGNKHELAAYLEGPNAYYLIVLSNDTPSLLEKHRKVFMAYVANFTPMGRK